ncbi:MAG TPA: cysteine desulfurase family protein [Thermomicrobiales bacterium]|jgi:cysteine desulfurase|nr:cysteine desulfurase family protein [Thermomicrobiales bacterium]
MDDTIYLDHAATTPLDPDVLGTMLPYFTERYGNPSSIYQLGQEARAAIDQARAACARVLGCEPSEIIFTSGATESDNLALRGVAWGARLALRNNGALPHIVTTAIEHHAVLHTANSLQREGFSATYVAPDSRGIVDPEAIAAAVRPETCLISVMYANNESGAIQPIQEIAEVARDRGIPLHTDAVQAAGTLSVNVDALGVDLLSLSAHKFYGPKGVGLLYVRRGTTIDFQQKGGGQEQGRRGGTENVPGIVGLGMALERADAWRDAYADHCARLRDRLADGLFAAIPEAMLNGPSDLRLRLPNNLNVTIPGIQGETLLLSLDVLGVAASAGSACTTGNTEPSHVLRAMGLSDDGCRSALRFTVGRSNTEQQIDDAIDALVGSVDRARSLVASVAI